MSGGRVLQRSMRGNIALKNTTQEEALRDGPISSRRSPNGVCSSLLLWLGCSPARQSCRGASPSRPILPRLGRAHDHAAVARRSRGRALHRPQRRPHHRRSGARGLAALGRAGGMGLALPPALPALAPAPTSPQARPGWRRLLVRSLATGPAVLEIMAEARALPRTLMRRYPFVDF